MLNTINDIIYEYFLFFYIIIYVHMCTVKKTQYNFSITKKDAFLGEILPPYGV